MYQVFVLAFLSGGLAFAVAGLANAIECAIRLEPHQREDR